MGIFFINNFYIKLYTKLFLRNIGYFVFLLFLWGDNGMKYCPNCGEKLDGDSNFCDNCGNQVSDNINDKPNSNNSRKSISDIIDPILARPKLLLLIIIVLVVIIGVGFMLFSNSNSNISGGHEITVDGVNFHIPEGFKQYSLPGTSTKTESQFALYSSDGRKAVAYIHIKVSDNISPSSELAKTLSTKNKVTINGKECSLRQGGDSVSCAYYDSNNKAVQLQVPYSYEYNGKVIYYEDTLAQMIK